MSYNVQCSNCVVYNWPPPPKDMKLLRCANCKVLHYCSKECQQEHWKKVHKYHCKYLSGKAKLPGSDSQDNCPQCKEEEKLGSHELTNPKNPHYGCHLKFSFKRHQQEEGVIELPLGEGGTVTFSFPFPLTAKNGPRIEQTIEVLQKLLYKMYLTKHIMVTKYREEINALREIFQKARHGLWKHLLFLPKSAQNFHFGHRIQEWFKEVGSIYEKTGLDKDVTKNCQDPFDMWRIFKLLFGFLWNRLEVEKKLSEKIPLSSYPEECRNHVEYINPDKYFDMWDRILNALSKQLVPYTNLVEIFCYGDRKFQCVICDEDTTVVSVRQDFDSEVEYQPYITPFFEIVSCPREVCFDKAFKLYVIVFYNPTIGALMPKMRISDKCDNCFLMCEKAHRCKGCLTKLYCDEECLRQDWEKVHKKVCKKDDRKIKGDQKIRKNERKKKTTEVQDSLTKLHEACPGPPFCRLCNPQ